MALTGCWQKLDARQKEGIIKKLRDNGCRITKQRKILLDIILEDECTCCKEIYYKSLKQDKTIGIATVYRMINALEAIGALDRKKFYQIVCDENCEAKGACVIEFDDGSSVELSENKWNEVVKCGLEGCGYCNGKKLLIKNINNRSAQTS